MVFGSLHRGLDRVLLGPIGTRISFYSKVLEAHELRKHNVITEAEYQQIVSELGRRYFLGLPAPARIGIGPANTN